MALSMLHPLSKLPNYPSLSLFPTTRRLQISSCLALDRTNENPSPAAGTNDLRIVFAAGGTGGHIYPAIAIADEIMLLEPSARILFIGSDSGMERTAVPSAGFDFDPVRVSPLTRPLFSPQNLLLPFRVLQSTAASLSRLRSFQPQIVVGTGGYVSFPVCVAAALSGAKLVLQEQNSTPGVANRILGKFADLVFVAFDSCLGSFPEGKCVLSGNPVRVSLRRFISKTVARTHFFPKVGGDSASGAQVLLVLGGSLGSNAINFAILNIYYNMLKTNKKRFIIWQTGIEGLDETESLVKKHPRLFLTPYLHSMDLAFAAADLVVARAGAMTCSEILATGKPSILIPSPNVAEDHQTKNALAMSSIAGSTVLLEDELDSITLGKAIDDILGNENLIAEISEKALNAARPDASAQIAQSIISLAQTQKKRHRYW